MKHYKKIMSGLILVMALGLISCSKKDKATNTLTNGSFEDGALTGWTTEGNAFQRSGVVDNDTVEAYEAGKAGTYFFNGLEAGPQSFTGSMKSENFIIEGIGYITFLMGAGKEPEKCYVTVHDAKTDKEIARQAASDFDGTFVTTQMIRYIIDVSEYIGTTAYIKVTDNDNGDSFAYVIVDDFNTYIKDDEMLKAYQLERTNKLASLVPPPLVEDEQSTTIQNGGFENGDLSGWKILSGTAFNVNSIVDAAGKFWDVREFNAIGNKLLNGYNNAESSVGEIRSSKFTLSGDGYISFLIGGSASSNCFVSIHDGNTDEELFKISNEYFKDPEMSLNMHRVYVDASSYVGRVLYIKITDKADGGPFGAITADDFLVSMTKEEVQSVMLETYQWAMSLGDDSISAYIKDFYMKFDYPLELPVLRITKKAEGQAIYVNDSVDVLSYISDVKGECGLATDVLIGIESVTFGSTVINNGFDKIDMSAAGVYAVHYYVEYENMKVYDDFYVNVSNEGDILNAGFESGNLAGWTVLTTDTLNVESAISSDLVFWGEEIPYNSNGVFHFNGWGAQHDEADAYSLKSSNFMLGGSGFISFKMGGAAAAVKVYKADQTLIGTYINTAFMDMNFPNLDEGCRLATMTTFVADLSSYIGEELYIELHDLGAGAWGIALFDEIIVNYDAVPIISESSDPVIFNKKVDDSLTPTEFDIPFVEAVNINS